MDQQHAARSICADTEGGGGCDERPPAERGTAGSALAEVAVCAGAGQPDAQRLTASLLRHFGAVRFERFFGASPAARVAERGLEVTVKSGFAAALLDRQFKPVVLAAALAVGAVATDVRFVVAAGEPERAAPPRLMGSEAPAPAPARARSGVPRGALRQFDLGHFVPGAWNRLASEAAGAMGGLEAPSARLVHVFGGCGLGKTHLAHGAALRLSHARPGARVRVYSGEGFAGDFIGSVRGSRVDAFRAAVRGLDLLCVDDVAGLVNKPSSQRELVAAIDAVLGRGGRVLTTGVEPPRRMVGLSDALVSRLSGGVVAGLEAPGAEDRERLAGALARRRGLALEPVAARVLAAAMPEGSTVRDLEGMVVKVEAIHRLLGPGGAGSQGGRVGVLTVERALRGVDGAPAGGARRPIRFAAILAAVCSAVGVTEDEVMSSGRHAAVVVARGLCVYAARGVTTMSYPEIARALRRPNHSSVITAYQRVCRQIGAATAVRVPARRGDDVGLEELAEQVMEAARSR